MKDGRRGARKYPEAYKKDLSKRLRIWRTDNDMTLIELGDKIGVTREAIRLWENGTRPSEKSLKKLAKVLGVSTDEMNVFVDYNSRESRFMRGIEKLLSTCIESNVSRRAVMSHIKGCVIEHDAFNQKHQHKKKKPTGK